MRYILLLVAMLFFSCEGTLRGEKEIRALDALTDEYADELKKLRSIFRNEEYEEERLAIMAKEERSRPLPQYEPDPCSVLNLIVVAEEGVSYTGTTFILQWEGRQYGSELEETFACQLSPIYLPLRGEP